MLRLNSVGRGEGGGMKGCYATDTEIQDSLQNFKEAQHVWHSSLEKLFL